jgi:23S rRNA pseudouridine955/2504/2580 synthase
MSGKELETTGRAQTLTVGEQDAGQRIDNFLQRLLRDVPRNHIYRLLRRGEVRVNARRTKAPYKLVSGDQVRIPPVRISPGYEAPTIPSRLTEDLERSILYEDADLVVVDKPAGLAVHSGSGLAFGLIDVLRDSRSNAPFLELVHRLDRDTSGCLLLAKSRRALTELQASFRDGKIGKTYLALLLGRWRGGAREVEVRLRRQALRGGERVVTIDAERGRVARSRFVPQERFREGTLMRVELGTGRTHQIRVQAAELGHPVAGDAKYGDKAFNARMRTLGLRRQFLHAWRLAFRQPLSGRPIRVEAPLTEEQQKVLAALRQSEAAGIDR